MPKTDVTPYKLSQFIGSETFYRHPLNRHIIYTEGAKYVAENAGAYWLLDEIALLQSNPAVRAEPFQVWRLEAAQSNSANLVMEDGNYNKIFGKRIEYTDFPLSNFSAECPFELWCENGSIYLPDER